MINIRTVILLIGGVLICLVFALAKREVRKKEAAMNEHDFVVRQPKSSLILYIIVGMFFFLLFFGNVMSALDMGSFGKAVKYLVPFSPFLLIGPFLIWLWCRWKIIVRGNEIIATPNFGKTKFLTFSDITYVEKGKNLRYNTEFITVYCEKKKLISVSNICPGYTLLRSRLAKEGKL